MTMIPTGWLRHLTCLLLPSQLPRNQPFPLRPPALNPTGPASVAPSTQPSITTPETLEERQSPQINPSGTLRWICRSVCSAAGRTITCFFAIGAFPLTAGGPGDMIVPPNPEDVPPLQPTPLEEPRPPENRKDDCYTPATGVYAGWTRNILGQTVCRYNFSCPFGYWNQTHGPYAEWFEYVPCGTGPAFGGMCKRFSPDCP